MKEDRDALGRNRLGGKCLVEIHMQSQACSLELSGEVWPGYNLGVVAILVFLR